MRELWKINRFIWMEKRDSLLSLLFGFIAGITVVGLFAVNGYLISIAALEPPLYVLIFMVAIVKVGSVLRAISRYAERYYSHRATFTMLSHLRVYFYDQLEPLASKLLQRYRSGDLLARIVGDIESLQNFFLRVIYPPLIMVFVFMCTVVFVSVFSIPIMIVLLLGLLFTGFILPSWFILRQRKHRDQIREKRAGLSMEVTEWIYGYKELKLYQRLDEKEQRIIESSAVYVVGEQNAHTEAVRNQSIQNGFSFFFAWTLIAFGVYFVTNDQLNGLYLAMLVMIGFIVFEHATPMAIFSIHYDESKQAVIRLEDVISQNKNEPVMYEMNHELNGAPSVEMKDVSFGFEGEYRKSIDQVSFYLPAGSKTAIVGPSGSGKSTLLQLIFKINSVHEGSIEIGGIPLTELSQEQVWHHTTVILQENHFFFGTVLDNLLLTNDKWTDEQIMQLLQEVQLAHFSLNDLVLERGQNLSGGEKQRLAIARAMVKGGSLWLLDEPSSALDALTEQKVWRLISNHAKNDTVVVISHHLEGLEWMDQILVMDQGRIIESGTYKSLMAKQGYFYQLKKIEQSIVV